jgi:small subunit ribosomal protein S3
MAHRVHPKAFRIRETQNWNSRGFYQKEYASYLEEDFQIRKLIEKKFEKMAVEKVEIERSPSKVSIIISSIRPGLIIGRGGEGIENLKKEIEEKIVKGKKEVKIEVKETKDPWLSASVVAQWIASQIEKRTPYRRTLKQALERIMSRKGVKGAKVQVSGRLDGVEIARTEWLKKGQLPRQTLRADIDYATSRAFCRYGIVGIKVWIYRGEKYE